MNRRSTLLTTVIFTALLLCSGNLFAQFTYLWAGPGYAFTKFQGNGFKTTDNMEVTINFGGLYQFIRKAGIGISIGAPIYQKTQFSFASSDLGFSFNDFNNESSEGSQRYVPDVYDYETSFGPEATLLLRYFINKNSTFYADVTLSKLSLDETFDFQRSGKPGVHDSYGTDYPPVTAVAIHVYKNYNLFYPGFDLGWSAHLSDHLKLAFLGRLEYPNFGPDRSFDYIIAFNAEQYTNTVDTTPMKSPLVGYKPRFEFNTSVSYFF